MVWDTKKKSRQKIIIGRYETEADIAPETCGSSFSGPAMLSDMPKLQAVPVHDVLSWDVEVRHVRGTRAIRSRTER